MNWRNHDTARSYYIASSDEPDLQLHLRAHGDAHERLPVLFVHGATYASRLYDVPHPGASWLKATAEAGYAAYPPRFIGELILNFAPKGLCPIIDSIDIFNLY